MFVRTQWLVLRIGYDIHTDLPYGVSLCLGKASGSRWLIYFHYDWPKVIWADKYWRVDESGVLKGVPVPRAQIRLMDMVGLRYWPKTMFWPRCFKVTQV